MEEESVKLREEIKARQEELAGEILRLQYREQPELEKRYDERSKELCLQDIQYHLSYLAEAVSSSSISLFVDYIEWVRVLLSGLGLPEEDLSINLRCIREVLLDRLSGMGRDVLQACLDSAISRLEHPQQEPHSFIDVEQPLGGLARGYLDSLLDGDRGRALGLVKDAFASGVGLKDIYLHVFQPCQQELGRLWHTRRISVAQEHFCTAATQLIMSQLYPLVFDSEKKGLRCVAACVSGELHEMGIRMVSDFLEMEGWDTYYLGANAPASDILSAIEERRADLLAISSTMAYHLEMVRDLIESLRGDPRGVGVKVMVGGYPFNRVKGLWKKVGADGYAGSAEEAVAVAERLVSERA